MSCYQPSLLLVWMLMVIPLTSGQGAQRNIRYICEHAELKYSPGMVLVAPGYSYNPGLVQANCTTTVTAQPGLRLTVEIYQQFAIKNCSSDFLRLDDGVNNEFKCGVISTYQPIYVTATSRLHVWYQSGSNTDKTALSLKAFGCETRRAVSGTSHTLVYEKFNQSTEEYKADLRCDAGHLIEGTLGTAASLLCRQDHRHGIYEWVGRPSYRCVAAKCPIPAHLVNGRMTFDSLIVGAKAMYSCDTGYVLHGTKTLHCVLQSGRGAFWEGAKPFCKVIDCGSLAIPNAIVTSHILDTTYNASVSFSCIDGFHLPPNQREGTARCTGSGQWWFTPCSVKPVCSQHHWTAAGYSVEKVSSLVYQLSCSSTQEQLNITCVANETWSTQLPQCIGLLAAQQEALTNESLTVIGVCVAVTLLVVLTIVIIIIVLLRRKQRKTKTEIEGLSYPSPPTARPVDPGYSRVDVHQTDNGQSSLAVEPERIHAPAHKLGEMTPRRTDVYSQVRKPRRSEMPIRNGGGRVNSPVRMMENDLYGTNQESVRF